MWLDDDMKNTTTTEATTTQRQCRAFIHDGSLPSNTSQVRQCRNNAVEGSKWCVVHA